MPVEKKGLGTAMFLSFTRDLGKPVAMTSLNLQEANSSMTSMYYNAFGSD